ncbi:MAG TPA: hypothetical protein VMB80_18245 [Candidatus Acidoferrum sp.]|nr:hypothetical protein [Candidatus Acidoferrum sp.]
MKKTIVNFSGTMALAAGMFILVSCSSAPKNEPGVFSDNPIAVPGVDRGGVILDAVTATATVQSVNAADRTVVLQHPDGSTTVYECGPDVRNFDQIKVGDHVTATVAESIAIGLMKGGNVPTGAGTASAIVRAPAGAKPGGKIVDTVGFIAKVMSVDVASRQVTLQMADGSHQTVKVGPDINLANVNPGDNVGVRVTRAFAIAVTAPGTAPAAP